MLEIIALIYLWRVNGANAYSRGKSRRKYQFLTLILWFGCEIVGTMAGVTIWLYFFPEQNYLMGSYLLGIPAAALGGFLSYRAAKKGPVIRNEESNAGQNSVNWNSAPGSYSYNESASSFAQSENKAELLPVPATIRIIEELGGYGGTQDYFYINGQPVCALYPGMEAVLKTNNIRNTLTIGAPSCDSADTLHCVKFVAAENGMIEIHASEGKLLPELFKNYASN